MEEKEGGREEGREGLTTSSSFLVFLPPRATYTFMSLSLSPFSTKRSPHFPHINLPLENVPVTDKAEEKEEEEEKAAVGKLGRRKKAQAEGRREASTRHAMASRRTGGEATGLCPNILRACMVGARWGACCCWGRVGMGVEGGR